MIFDNASIHLITYEVSLWIKQLNPGLQWGKAYCTGNAGGTLTHTPISVFEGQP